jgi:gliding motility-associated lipoprotein GldH
MNLRNSLIFIFFVGFLFSCDKKRIFDHYETVGSAWNKNQTVSIKLPEIDSTKNYNLFINLRANNDFPYSNLFLIVSLEQPDGFTKVDTLEYEMANAEGKLLGDGFSDVKESKLVYKENNRFKFAKNNTIYIKQAVRQSGKVTGIEKLDGITEVGFRIESLQ